MKDSRKEQTIFSIVSGKKIGGTDPSNYGGVFIEDIATVKEVVHAEFFPARFCHFRRTPD